MMELLPWAIFAKGPACTKAGVPSRSCIRVGMMASFIRTVMAPAQPRSSAVIASPDLLAATTILPKRSRMSARSVVSAKIAMTSLATVISKPVSRVNPISAGPCPIVILRSMRSLMSTTRFQFRALGFISRRTKRLISSPVRSLGSLLLIPSFSIRLSIEAANLRLPSLAGGHRRLKSSSSV